MEMFNYRCSLTFTTEARSKKEADKSLKATQKDLSAFCSVFCFTWSVSEATARTDIPGVYRYIYRFDLSLRLPPSYILSVSHTVRLFANINKIEMTDESYYADEDEC